MSVIPQAQEWIQAVREEIESFKRLGVYEEMAMVKPTSTPLPARLILVTKPNVHAGPARKKARIVICGNFQEAHPDEFTTVKDAKLSLIEDGIVSSIPHGMAK